MREILFRGKPVYKEDYTLNENVKCSVGYFKGGFAYGSLIVIGDTYFICTGVAGISISLINNTTATLVEVDPETVGQYIDFDDKNGKKIFEGDIVKYKSNSPCRIYYIDCEFVMMWDKFARDFEQVYDDEIEIIGNIYDNPELFEV